MNRQQMEKLAEKLNQEEHVYNACVVEFLGKAHIHVDLESDDIEVVTENGESRIIPIHTSTRRQYSWELLEAIGNFIFNNDYDESYEQGSNWAERVIEAGDELSWNEASELADECGKDPDAFYDGYRDNWNAFADVWNSQHGYKEPSWWDKLRGRG